MSDQKHLNFDDFRIVWIAVLPVEFGAALCMFDEIFEKDFPTVEGDDYVYTGGLVQGHKVLLATIPEGTNYGGNTAAALASQIKKCVLNIWLVFLVGIAGGIPDHTHPSSDIRLGDVLVPLPGDKTPSIVPYDAGRETPEEFEVTGQLHESRSIMRAKIGQKKALARHRKDHYAFLRHLQRDEVKSSSDFNFKYPGQQNDKLYQSVTNDQAIDEEELIERSLRDPGTETRVWYGRVGSGNKLMNSSKERDALREKHKIVGLEMEAHGVGAVLPVTNIRGVCDYADTHKNDDWQPYAAIVAAAYARELLGQVEPPKLPKETIERFDVIKLVRNDFMIARPAITEDLARLLPQDGKPHQAALYGLGGIGKTQLALDFAYRIKDKTNCSLFWIVVSTEAQFIAGYTEIARKARLPTDLKGVELLKRVCEWLDAQKNWFLVLDNADESGMFERASVEPGDSARIFIPEYVPKTSAGSVLWTTRDMHIAATLVDLNRSIPVEKMTMAESLGLLKGLNTTDISDVSDDEQQLLGPQALDGLPLAINQARAFMALNSTSVKQYLGFFKNPENEVLQTCCPDGYRDGDEHRRGVPGSVLHTYAISMKYLMAETPDGEAASKILKTISFFDNQEIPHELLEKSAYLAGNDTEDLVSEFRLHKILGRLIQYSFLQKQSSSIELEKPSYIQHPLLQHAVQFSLDTRERQTFTEQSRNIVKQLFPIPRFENWNTCKRFLPHLLKICKSSTLDEVGAVFLERLARYHGQQSLFSEAEAFALQAVEVEDRKLSRLRLNMMSAEHELANIYVEQGRFKEAELLQVQVLDLRKEVLGEKHADTIIAIHNLAFTWQSSGRYQEAEPLQVQVLDLCKEILGEKHAETIRAMNNLAFTWQSQGRYQEAEPLQFQVLDLWREVLGKKHVDTIRAMNNLAFTWHSQGRYQEAEPLQVQVLDLWKEVLGEKHADTITAINNLALIWQSQGRYEEAEKLLMKLHSS